MVADAVAVEPVSAFKFPITGKLNGNFSGMKASLQFPVRLPAAIQWFVAKFPMQWKWEFLGRSWQFCSAHERAHGNFSTACLAHEICCCP